MKKYIIVLLALCLLLPAVTAFQGSHLKVSMVNQIPDPAEPGKYVDVRLKVENLGDESIENVEIEFVPSYPFSIEDGENKVKKISNLDSPQKDSRAVILKYKIRVDDRAVEGDNSIRFNVKKDGDDMGKRIFYIDLMSTYVNLELKSVNVTPSPGYPGEKAKMVLEAENLANSPLRNVRFKLNLRPETAQGGFEDLPFVPLKHGTEKEISVVEAGERVSLFYELMIDPDASTGTYKIPITIYYYDQLNQEYFKDEVIGLIVNSEPALSVILDEDRGVRPGRTNEVSIRFTNKGLPDLKFLTATIQETEQFEVFSPKESYMGNLDSDFYDMANYKLYIEPTNESFVTIPITYEYMDALNNKYTISEELQVRVLTPELEERMGISHETGGSAIVYIIIGVVVLFVVYKYYKKRKRK